MSKLQIKLVAIKRIELPDISGLFAYTQPQVEEGAKLFLEAKGFINPLVLEKTNSISEEVTPSDRYKVISGFLEYFCAVKAKEIDPSQEWVQAIIVNSDLSKNLIKQIELFRIGVNSIELDDDLDFELVTEDIDTWIDRQLEGESTESCFAAAERLCNLYSDLGDCNNAIAELETLKQQASGSKSARSKLDEFFAEAKGLYE